MKKVLGVLGSIATLVVLLFAMGMGKLMGRVAVDSYYGGKHEDTLARVASEVNRTLPKMVDADTRLDRTVAGPGLRFTYQYTLVTYPAPGQNPFDIYDNVDQFTLDLTHKVCNAAEMRPMLANGTTVTYVYNDKNGGKLFDVVIPPSRCR